MFDYKKEVKDSRRSLSLMTMTDLTYLATRFLSLHGYVPGPLGVWPGSFQGVAL